MLIRETLNGLLAKTSKLYKMIVISKLSIREEKGGMERERKERKRRE